MSKPLSLSKEKIKVVLLEGVDPSAEALFQKAGYQNIVCHKKALPETEFKKELEDAYIIGIRSRSQLSESILSEAKHLLAIGCFCIGTNQVDLIAAQHKGVPVFNAPFSNTRSVAELVLAEMILLLRRVPERNFLAHVGVWQKTAASSYEVRGKTLGIIGYGHIGSQLSILAEGLGMRVKYYDIETKLSLGNAEQVDSLELLLKESDIITLHVPETPQTKNIISVKELKLMKEKAVLINASRGTVVDIKALAKALEANQILGAAVDVFPKEPKSEDEAFISELQKLPNVILTPHIGGSTQEAQVNIGLEVAEKLIKYSDNGSTLSAVNFPEVVLPTHTGCHRLLHIHKNVPGMLQEINNTLSTTGANISGQYLQTQGDIGYVVIDLDHKVSSDVLPKLKAIEGTIRARVIY